MSAKRLSIVCVAILIPLLAYSPAANAAKPRKYTPAQIAHFETDMRVVYRGLPASAVADLVVIGKGACTALDKGKSIKDIDLSFYAQLKNKETQSAIVKFASSVMVNSVADLCPSHSNEMTKYVLSNP